MNLPLGTIVAHVGRNWDTENWLRCDGGTIPPQYSALSSLIGAETPDLRGRSLLGSGVPSSVRNTNKTSPNFPSGADFQSMDTGGSCEVVLTKEQMPKHQHQAMGQHNKDKWPFGDSGGQQNFGSGAGTDSDNLFYNTSFEGESEAHPNMSPYFVVDYYIYAGPANSGGAST